MYSRFENFCLIRNAPTFVFLKINNKAGIGTKYNLIFTLLDTKLFFTKSQKYKVNFNVLNKCITLDNK